MNDKSKDMNVLDLLYILAKGWKIIAINLVVITSLAVVISLILPKWYEATATILPPKEQKKGFGFSELLSSLPIPSLRLGEKGSPADIFIGILKSDRVANKIVDKFDLEKVYKVRTREEAIRMLRKNTDIGKTDEGLIRVTVLDRDPKRCADIANAYIAFLDSVNQEISRSTAGERKKFIEKQLAVTRDELKRAQKAMIEFQQEHNAISVPIQAEAVMSLAAQLEIEKLDLQRKLLNLKSSVGPAHPQVRDMEDRIRILEKQMEALRNGRSSGFGSELFMPLKDLPEVALEYARLERDVLVQGTIEEILLQQLAESSIEENNTTSTVQILDRALPPQRKAKPNRRLIVFISAALSLVLGIFAVLGIEYFNSLKESDEENSRKLEKILNEFRWRKETVSS